MRQPLYDLDLSRVTRKHYITGKAAINFPSSGGVTGGWHFQSYWNRDSGVCKVSLAGIHYLDTTAFFGDVGIHNMTKELERRGWSEVGHVIFMADHFRAAGDMLLNWALSDSQHCNVEIAEWFPGDDDRLRFLDLLATAGPRLKELGRFEKVERWLLSQ